MARKLYYKVEDHPSNKITDEEWDAITRLQKWYNSEFIWTGGRLAFKMYVVFPNWEYLSVDRDAYWEAYRKRARELRWSLPNENEVIRTLEREKLIVVRKGGYLEGSLASGFTKVAGNEFNAYLTCEFILKASMIAPNCDIVLWDEGEFIKCRKVYVRQGRVRVRVRDSRKDDRTRQLVRQRRVFSVVNPDKYNEFPTFKTVVAGFTDMDDSSRRKILQDWNWLGFSSGYDVDGDDVKGYNLNDKVLDFEIETIA